MLQRKKKVEVVLSAADINRLRDILPSRIGALALKKGKRLEAVLSEHTGDMSGGFILKNGRH